MTENLNVKRLLLPREQTCSLHHADISLHSLASDLSTAVLENSFDSKKSDWQLPHHHLGAVALLIHASLSSIQENLSASLISLIIIDESRFIGL